jgi:porphobilinogen deaminase
MEGPGLISNILNEKQKPEFKGNFETRLKEAKRIHRDNMILASRLDSVEPYYKKTDLTVVRPFRPKRIIGIKTKPKKRKMIPELEKLLRQYDNDVNILNFLFSILFFKNIFFLSVYNPDSKIRYCH